MITLAIDAFLAGALVVAISVALVVLAVKW